MELDFESTDKQTVNGREWSIWALGFGVLVFMQFYCCWVPAFFLSFYLFIITSSISFEIQGRIWMTRASRTRSSVWKVSDKRPGCFSMSIYHHHYHLSLSFSWSIYHFLNYYVVLQVIMQVIQIQMNRRVTLRQINAYQLHVL